MNQDCRPAQRIIVVGVYIVPIPARAARTANDPASDTARPSSTRQNSRPCRLIYRTPDQLALCVQRAPGAGTVTSSKPVLHATPGYWPRSSGTIKPFQRLLWILIVRSSKLMFCQIKANSSPTLRPVSATQLLFSDRPVVHCNAIQTGSDINPYRRYPLRCDFPPLRLRIEWNHRPRIAGQRNYTEGTIDVRGVILGAAATHLNMPAPAGLAAALAGWAGSLR